MYHISEEKKYPAITQLINSDGRLELGFIPQMQITALAVQEGATIWEGKKNYQSIEDLLEDAEQGIKAWIDETW